MERESYSSRGERKVGGLVGSKARQKDDQRYASMNTSDTAIKATANDAIIAKLSTSQYGYYDDPFLPYFARDASGLVVTTTSSSNTSSIKARVPTIASSTTDDYDGRSISTTETRRQIGSSQLAGHHDDKGRISYSPAPSRSLRERQRLNRHLPQPQQQQQPVIRRGTHARVCVIDYAITTFLSSCAAQNSDLNKGSEQNDVQVVILGSGRDTTYLRSQSGHLHCKLKAETTNKSEGQTTQPKKINGHVIRSAGPLSQNKTKTRLRKRGEENVKIRWYEVDHPSVVKAKFELMQSCDLIHFDYEVVSPNHDISTRSSTASVEVDGQNAKYSCDYIIKPTYIKAKSQLNLNATRIASDKNLASPLEPCHLISYDLRKPFEKLLENMEGHHQFQRDKPTLFVMECVQMYIPEYNSRDIWNCITNTCLLPCIAIFDPILGDYKEDGFGRVMVQNLTNAKVVTTEDYIGANVDSNTHQHSKEDRSKICLLQTRSLQQHVDKLVHCGFQSVVGCNFYNAYESILTADDRRRANMTEMLDEVEEWMLIMRHYCFLVAGGGMVMSSETDKDHNMQYSAIVDKFCSTGEESALGFGKHIKKKHQISR